MALLVLGINHRTASIELREKLAFSAESTPLALQSALQQTGLTELLILSTCNRTELYCAHADTVVDDDLLNWLAHYHHLSVADLGHCVYFYREDQAIRHALRVASGLDSMVLGEPQILGQMKAAFGLSTQHGAIDTQLNRLFQQAFSAAKQVRTETEIGQNPVSVAYAATALAKHIFTDLKHTSALLVGAGEMIELVARHLHEQGVAQLRIANRTHERATELAQRFGGEGLSLADITHYLHEADIVITSTASPLPVLGKGLVESALKQRKHKPMFMVDLAVPRDIEPEVSELPDVYLYTIDDLQGVIAENLKSRKVAAAEAEIIIENRVVHYLQGLRERTALETLTAYRQKIEGLKQSELDKALLDLRSGGDPEQVVASLAHKLSNKIMHQPTQALKQAGAEGRDDLLEWAQTLLGIDANDNPA